MIDPGCHDICYVDTEFVAVGNAITIVTDDYLLFQEVHWN
jgi:hypothetical protein